MSSVGFAFGVVLLLAVGVILWALWEHGIFWRDKS